MSIEIRQFNLVNSEGETYTLTLSNKYTGFLGVVDGLGYEKSPEYQRIGSELVQLTDLINQKVISGTVQFFQPHAYQEFTRFAWFCQDNDLTLYYQIPTGLFLKKGSITKIEKSEGSDSLKVKIDFTPKTLWYREIKRDIAAASLMIISESAIESPCCLSFKGVTVTENDFSWSQKVDNTTIMTGTLKDVTIAATDTVYVRTDTNPYQIYKIDAENVKTDLYAMSDFSTSRFPLLYKGNNEFIVTGASEITVEGRELFETV
ncbi:MAG: hypothetical protein K6B14_07400 [Lachnospiraceae bacterium]|nr:hypothetical protein [Lachnospiraceae bacterium]